MSRALTITEHCNDLRALLIKCKPQIATALPKHITADRLSRVVMTTVQKTPTLLNCTRESLLGAIFEAAQLGLEPDGVLGHAYLVPFGKTVTLIVGYKGLIDLVRRSGQLSTIYATCVYDGDQFDYSLGTEPAIVHRPGVRGDDEKITHAYAVARLRDGGIQFEVMTVQDIEKIRKRSKASGNGPWVTDWEMMARKTVLRRLCKVLPVSVEASRAIAREDEAESGQIPDFDLPDDVRQAAIESQTPPAETLADVTEKLKSRGNGHHATPESPKPEWNIDLFRRALAEADSEDAAREVYAAALSEELDDDQQRFANRCVDQRLSELAKRNVQGQLV